MRIQHNIMALNAYRNYNTNVSAMKSNLEKLSSGYKINRAGDDAAGLAISEKMRAQITGLNAAQKNVKDGISLVQTAEGAMQEVQDMLNRMVYLATQSANGTYDNDVDRANLQKEMDQLRNEIDRISDSANFNGIKLLDGTPGLNTDAFQVLDPTAAATGSAITTGIITTDMTAAGTQVGTNTILHKSGTEAQKGFFTVDLSQLKLESTTAGAGDIEITIGGTKITVAATAAGASMDGAAIAAALVSAINATAVSGLKTNGSGGLLIGDAAATANKGQLLYTAALGSDPGTVTFTATKVSNGTNWVALTDDLPTADVVDGALATTGFDVSVAGKTTANIKSLTGNPNIDATNTQIPQKPGDTAFGNASLTIDVTKLTKGMEMTIAGQTKVIGTDIKLDDLDLTDSTDQAKAMDRITQAFADNQHVSVGQDGGTLGKLTLSEKVGSDGKSAASEDMQKAMSTLDGFKGLVSFKSASTGVKTNIKVTDANVKEGNTLNIDGKKYVFSDKKTGTEGDVTYVAIAGGAGANLATAIGDKATYANSTVSIEAADANAAAPKILGKGLTMQIGDTADDFNQLSVEIGDIHTDALGIDKIRIDDQDSAAKAVQKIKDAINSVSSIRGDLGATQNRLEHTANNLSVMSENITDAESSIRDTDIAEEMMAYTKNNILIQAAQAMLAQANQVPQGVLQLLQ